MTEEEENGSAIARIAAEIVDYVRVHDNAADTLDGITDWWITRQRIHEQRRRVEQALAHLCSEGLLAKKVLPDGSVLYRATKGKD